MTKKKRGVVLMNLGSPDSTRVGDVRKYLTEFLLDKRVIDKPFLLRKFLVQGIIVPFRAPKSAEAYASIWGPEGSPLVAISAALRDKLRQRIEEPVSIAMRYGNPSMEKAFDDLLRECPGLEEVIAIPLYPHYAMSSYETAVEHARNTHRKKKYGFRLTFVPPFYAADAYIDALSEHIRPWLGSDWDHILFSFHGIPERHLTKADPTGSHCLASPGCCSSDSPAHATCYRHQCLTTMRLVTERLGIPAGKFSYAFQSRLGREPWLKPYTDFRLQEMPGEGIRKLLILCPAFVSDCLETLEEIDIRGKETFLGAGGESFRMIPCLNTDDRWVDALAGWVRKA